MTQGPSLRVEPSGTLHGSVPVPADLVVVRRATVLAAIAQGTSIITGETAAAVQQLLVALEQLGAPCRQESRRLLVEGRGLTGFAAPTDAIELVDDVDSAALLLGLLAGRTFPSHLVLKLPQQEGHAARVILAKAVELLNERGANAAVEATEEELHVIFKGRARGKRLEAGDWNWPRPEPQLKATALLSGLFAAGPTAVHEAVVSEDHLERMLHMLRMPLETVGPLLRLHPPAEATAIEAFELKAPGSVSVATFLLVAAAILPGSRIAVRDVSVNPTRVPFYELLRAFGPNVQWRAESDAGLGEPAGQVVLEAPSRLIPAALGGESMAHAGRLDVLMVMAACAEGVSELELEPRAGYSARGWITLLEQFGVRASLETGAEGPMLRVWGCPGRLQGTTIDADQSPERALAATALALRAERPVEVRNIARLAQYFPRLAGTLRALGAQVKVIS